MAAAALPLTRPRVLAVVGVGLMAALLLRAAIEWAGIGVGPDLHVVTTGAQRDRVAVHLIVPHSGETLPLAHYVEHLAILGALGGAHSAPDRHSNAWVSHQAFGYWMEGPRTDLPEIVATLAAVFEPIDLPTAFAEGERDIILREYDHVLGENLDARVHDVMDAVLYEGTAFAASIIGSREEISALEYGAALALHAATHRPANATMVVTGAATRGEVLRAMRAVDWPDRGDEPAGLVPPTFVLGEVPSEIVLGFVEGAAAPRLLWRRVVTLPRSVDFDLLEAEAALLRDILSSALPGGLASPMLFDSAISRSFDVAIWPIDDRTIELSLTAAPDRGVSLGALRAAFEAALAETAAAGVPRDTYDRVRARRDGYWPDWSDGDATSRWMASYVVDRVAGLRTPLAAKDLKELEAQSSPANADMILRALAGSGRTAVAYIGPEGMTR